MEASGVNFPSFLLGGVWELPQVLTPLSSLPAGAAASGLRLPGATWVGEARLVPPGGQSAGKPRASESLARLGRGPAFPSGSFEVFRSLHEWPKDGEGGSALAKQRGEPDACGR